MRFLKAKKMKNTLSLFLALFVFVQTNAQNKWFSVYNDSANLVNDADRVIQQMADKIFKINPTIDLRNNTVIKNTKPFLIFIRNDTVNLPFWTEVIPPQQKFFAEVAGGEKEGKEVFGLFFNGFFIAHEMGHSFSSKAGKKFDNNYDSEYDANIIAILYWRAVGQTENLKKCYDYAQSMLKTLKNPVPYNEDYKQYITNNYSKLASDPYKYGYIQFSQFVKVYEDKALPDFETYIHNYQKKP